MKQRETWWSESRLGLTTPESYVLMYGSKAGRSRPFELALMELVAGGRLILTNPRDHDPFGLWSKSVALLAPNPEEQSPEDRPLSSLLDLLDETPPRTTRDGKTGVPVAELVQRARRKYGWLGGYAEAEVVPRLASRGLYERRELPLVGARWEFTRAGEAARAELERRLSHFGGLRLSLS